VINDKLCDDIEFKLGVRASSLKQKRGMPVVWLLQKRTLALMPQRISAPIMRELRQLRAKPRERLRYELALWKKMLPAMEENVPRNEVVQKLHIFLDAAKREQKLRTALSLLDRWIENQIASLNLRTTIRVLARNAKFDWQRLEKMPLALPIQSLAAETKRHPKKQR
jgi:hypothetical protein